MEEGEEMPKWILEEMKKLERSEKRFAAMTKEEYEAFLRSIGDDARFWEDFTDYYS